MEQAARSEQHSYTANSNLVLTGGAKREDGPTGEVTTLREALSLRKLVNTMGDRVDRSRPKELDDRLAKSRKKYVCVSFICLKLVDLGFAELN